MGDLDMLGAIRTGFEMGTRIQELRERQRQNKIGNAQAEQQFSLESDRNQLYNQREERLLEDTKLQRQQESDALRRQLVDREAAQKFIGDASFFESLNPTGDRSAALRFAAQRNPGAPQLRDMTSVRALYADEKPEPTIKEVQLPSGERGVMTTGGASFSRDPAEKETAAARNAKLIVESRKASGEKFTPEQEAGLMGRLVGMGGRAQPLPAKQLDTLVGRAAVLDLLDNTVDDIATFNAKFGKDAFDAYVGKFDKPLNEVLDILRKRSGEQDKEALRILQQYDSVRNRTLMTRSGTAVTESEQRRLDAEVGTKADKNFPLKIRNFRNIERKTLGTLLDSYKDVDYLNVPDTVKKIYVGTSKAPTASGKVPFKIIKVETVP